MDGDVEPAPEVPSIEEEPTKAGASTQAAASPQPKAGKKKRTWQKVDLYNPAPYVAQKGAKKGGKGGGDKGRSPDHWEGGFKGRSKGKDAYGETEPPKARDDGAKGQSSEGFRPATVDGDPVQPRAAGAKGKLHGSKNREGKGKGKSLAGAPRKGFPSPPGGAAGAGLAAGPTAPAPGPMAATQGSGRGIGLTTDAGEAEMEPEGLRPPGPQRGHLPPGKGGPPQGGMVRVPMAMVPYPCGAAMPYAQGGMPYPMAAMYTMPCYPMAQSPTYFNTASFPMMSGTGGASQLQPFGGERQSLKSQVQSQLEYYFGDENLMKDVYLRSLMDEEGWVKLASLASFRLVRSMTTDMFVIADAIAASQKLELDPRGQHVRLKDTWQLWVSANQGSQ